VGARCDFVLQPVTDRRIFTPFFYGVPVVYDAVGHKDLYNGNAVKRNVNALLRLAAWSAFFFFPWYNNLLNNKVTILGMDSSISIFC
jgi:hypothetical protein